MMAVRQTLPVGWGKDTFTAEALDILRIAVAFGGYPVELASHIVLGHGGNGRINATTVEDALDGYRKTWEEVQSGQM